MVSLLARFITGLVQIDVLFLINRAVDFVFLFDMFVQARTPYREAKSGKLIRNPSKIFLRYFSGWFGIDLISVIPFELLGFIQGGEETASSSTTTDGAAADADASQLSILRVLRLLKLAKLLRIFRASRKLKQMQVYINLRYSTMQLVKVRTFPVVLIFEILTQL